MILWKPQPQPFVRPFHDLAPSSSVATRSCYFSKTRARRCSAPGKHNHTLFLLDLPPRKAVIFGRVLYSCTSSILACAGSEADHRFVERLVADFWSYTVKLCAPSLESPREALEKGAVVGPPCCSPALRTRALRPQRCCARYYCCVADWVEPKKWTALADCVAQPKKWTARCFCIMGRRGETGASHRYSQGETCACNWAGGGAPRPPRIRSGRLHTPSPDSTPGNSPPRTQREAGFLSLWHPPHYHP